MLMREIAEIDGDSHASLRLAPSDAAIILMLRKAWRMRAWGSSTSLLVARSMPCMPAMKMKSPARAPRLQVPTALMAPGGLSVLTPLGESERAGTRLVASEIAAQVRTTQGRICDLSLRGSACRGCGSSAATSTWSKSRVNIAAAKKATARSVSLPVLAHRRRQDEHAAGSGLM